MDADVNITKQKILEAIERKVPVFKRSSSTQYRIRCPFCGDSQKDSRDSHLYLKCSPDPTEPIRYNCFLCPAGGNNIKKLLTALGIDIPEMDQLGSTHYNRLMSVKSSSVEMMTGDPDMESDQVGYVEYRVGKGLSVSDYDLFKIVWNMELIKPYVSSQRAKHTLPSNNDSISFISDDKSMLLTRTFADKAPTWYKRKLFPNDNRSFYTIKAVLDMFTSDTITVNAAEGIFDILSVYKNFNTGNNSMYLAFLGKDYESIVDYIVAMGIIGSNVNVNIYLDSNINVVDIKRRFKKFKWLFGNITMFRNSKSDDFGHPIDKINPVEIKF